MAVLDIRDVAYVTTPINNTDESALTLTAQAAGTVVSSVLYNAKNAVRININITAVTGTLTVTVLGFDNTSGATWTALASAALGSTGLTRLTIGPYFAAAANVNAQDYPPTFYQIQAVVATGPVTATIGVQGIGG